MSVTPTGTLAIPEYLTARMVSLSAKFQSEGGHANAAAALTKVFYGDVGGDEARPCAVVNTSAHMYSLIAGGEQNQLRPAGSVFLYMALDFPEDYLDDDDNAQRNNAQLYAKSYFGTVVDQVVELAGQDQTADSSIPESQLCIKDVELIGVGHTPRDGWETELGRFFIAIYLIHWGDAE